MPFLSIALALALSSSARIQPRGDARSFTVSGNQFQLDGKPYIIRSGEMHYPRVPRQYWRQRMHMAKAMGLNTICTYVFWNLHEQTPGKFDFTGNLDVAEFVRTAQREGLNVIVRPGPYICTEWEWGGFPGWLFANPNITVRSTDPLFMQAASRYIKRVGKELAPLTMAHGGPIIMCQVENEYGSYGKDKEYLGGIRKMIRDSGIDCQLYTSDGPGDSMLNGGTLPDIPSVINFGGGNPAGEFAEFDKFRKNVPLMCGEYWIGWFDHWGEKHHTTLPDESAKGVEWMLSRGISFNLYMFHGGSSWGFMNGANFSNVYEPDISAYDYDSPLDEAGRPTEKFFRLRQVISKHLSPGEVLPAAPPIAAVKPIEPIYLHESAKVGDLCGKPVKSDKPMTMEAMGQNFGAILYRWTPKIAEKGELLLSELHDYAVVMQNSRVFGTLDRRKKQDRLMVDLVAGKPLEIFVENMGRVNFGKHIVDDRKGILGAVTLAGRELKGWENFTLPMENLSKLQFTEAMVIGPAFHRGTFELDKPHDTFLDLSKWGKGNVWVNNHNLGRYWNIGPQQTLFLPANWLKSGVNVVVVLDLESTGDRMLSGVANPIYDTPRR
ncbi:MAG: beta-galactosidase [Chthonomonadales bacterium]